MVFHHVIADGISVMRFTSDLLALCARLAAGGPADAGPALPLLPPVESLLRKTSSWIGFLARQMRATVLGPKATPIPLKATPRSRAAGRRAFIARSAKGISRAWSSGASASGPRSRGAERRVDAGGDEGLRGACAGDGALQLGRQRPQVLPDRGRSGALRLLRDRAGDPAHVARRSQLLGPEPGLQRAARRAGGQSAVPADEVQQAAPDRGRGHADAGHGPAPALHAGIRGLEPGPARPARATRPRSASKPCISARRGTPEITPSA